MPPSIRKAKQSPVRVVKATANAVGTTAAVDNDDDDHDRISRFIAQNRAILEVTNTFASLSLHLHLLATGPSLASLIVARFRFCCVLWLLFKMNLLLALNDCEHSQLRYYLQDWTVLYPNSRRVGIIRAFVCLCIFQMSLKMSIFFKRQKFDRTLVEYLTSAPPLSSASDESQSDEPKLVSPISSPSLLLSSSPTPSSSASSDLPARKPQDESSSWTGSRKPPLNHLADRPLHNAIQSTYQNRHVHRTIHSQSDEDNLNIRDRVHWIKVSEQLGESFRNTVKWSIPIGFFLVVAPVLRIAYSLVKEHDCSLWAVHLRLVGVIELSLGLAESLTSLIGMLTYTFLVVHDIGLQMDMIDSELGQLVDKIKDGYDDDDDGNRNQDKTRSPARRERDLEIGRLVGDADRDTTSTMKVSASASSTTGPKNLRRRSIFEPTNKFYMDSKAQRRLGEVLSLKSSGEPSSPRPLQALINQFLTNIANSSPANLKCDPTTLLVVEAQRKVIKLLKTIDSHKPLITFIGNAQYIWMVTSLTFVPLIFGSKRITCKDRMAFSICLGMCSISILTCMFFTAKCASVSHRVSLETDTVQ